MKRAFSIAIFILTPVLIFSQEWESSIEFINSNLKEIKSVRRIIEEGDRELHQDSLRIIDNSNFEDLVMEVYSTEIELDSEIEYVTAMQVPLTGLTSVSKNDYSIQLGFSKDCNQDGEGFEQYYVLEIPEEKKKYVMQAAFNHLRAVNREFHEKKHDIEICTFGN